MCCLTQLLVGGLINKETGNVNNVQHSTVLQATEFICSTIKISIRPYHCRHVSPCERCRLSLWLFCVAFICLLDLAYLIIQRNVTCGTMMETMCAFGPNGRYFLAIRHVLPITYSLWHDHTRPRLSIAMFHKWLASERLRFEAITTTAFHPRGSLPVWCILCCLRCTKRWSLRFAASRSNGCLLTKQPLHIPKLWACFIMLLEVRYGCQSKVCSSVLLQTECNGMHWKQSRWSRLSVCVFVCCTYNLNNSDNELSKRAVSKTSVTCPRHQGSDRSYFDRLHWWSTSK